MTIEVIIDASRVVCTPRMIALFVASLIIVNYYCNMFTVQATVLAPMF